MKLKIKNLRGLTLELDVKNNKKVKFLKQEASEFFGYETFELNYQGEHLSDDQRISDYNILDNSVILIVIPKPGCSPQREPEQVAQQGPPKPVQINQSLFEKFLEMGFPSERIEEVLKKTSNNEQLSLDILVNSRPVQNPRVEEFLRDKIDMNSLREALRRLPNLDILIDNIERNDPTLANLLRENKDVLYKFMME